MIDDSDILLGTGGRRPGLERYNTASGDVERVLSLSSGQSIYSIGVSAAGTTLAAGTKRGDVYWLTPEQDDPETRRESVRHLDGRAPILSVCFTDASTLAVADTTGRCVLRQLGADDEPSELPTGQRVICSLFQPDRRHLVGLSLCGRVLIWDLPEKRLVRTLDVPRPSDDLIALVRPVYWKAAEAWIWPGRDGTVVFFYWQRNALQTVCSHGSSAYVCLICHDQLLTISRDGTLRRWQAGHHEPVAAVEAPQGIISGAVWGEPPSQMILVQDSGKAGRYTWEGERLKFVGWLAGQDYRVALGPDPDRLRVAIRHRCRQQAGELAGQVKDSIKQHAWDELVPLYRQLAELGFDHVVWALRGYEAQVKNDTVAELAAYDRLLRIVPPNRPEIRGFLTRYADLLEVVWQVREAGRWYRYLSEADPCNDNTRCAVQRLTQYIEAVEGRLYVIETDSPLSSLVRSATAIGQAFTGRYLIKALEPPFHCLSQVPANELVRRYERQRGIRTQPHLPQAEQTELWYLSRHNVDRAATILLGNEDPRSVHRLEYAIAFVDAGPQTIMRRMILFNAGQRQDGMSVEQHNRILCGHLQNIQNAPSTSNGWLQMVDRNVTHAIRQLATKRMAEELRETGGNHE